MEYRDVKVGKCFEDDGYHFIKCVCLDEDSKISKYDYPAIEIETGRMVYFSPYAEVTVMKWKEMKNKIIGD